MVQYRNNQWLTLWSPKTTGWSPEGEVAQDRFCCSGCLAVGISDAVESGSHEHVWNPGGGGGGYCHTKAVGVCHQSPMEHMERERNQEIYGHQDIIIEQFI